VFGRHHTRSLLERDQWIQDVVASVPGPVGETLLSVLMLPEGERAALIGHLHGDSGMQSLADLLVDMEEDRALGLDLAQALKDRAAGL